MAREAPLTNARLDGIGVDDEIVIIMRAVLTLAEAAGVENEHVDSCRLMVALADAGKRPGQDWLAGPPHKSKGRREPPPYDAHGDTVQPASPAIDFGVVTNATLDRALAVRVES